MGGWGSIFLSVTPEGTALPCHSARQLPVEFPSVLEQSTESIWYDSFGFNRYRGFDWMPEPCRSCDEKEKDFGGCRCQPLCSPGMRITPIRCAANRRIIIKSSRRDAKQPVVI